MSNIQLLNNVTHNKLIVGDFNRDSYGSVLIVPEEVSLLQKEYPIFFRKDSDTGAFYLSAMLGFNSTENLYVDGGQWKARYVPAVADRGPFFIGFQNSFDRENDNNPVIYVDMDSPCIGDPSGQRMFLDTGEETNYTANVARRLFCIHNGIKSSKLLIDKFVSLNLIESLTLDIQFNYEEKVNLTGIYTVNMERLEQLDGGDLAELNRTGLLHIAYAIIFSLSNVQYIVDKKNDKLQCAAI